MSLQRNSVKTGGLQVRAAFVPGSFNREKRTVDVVFATDKPVLMGYYERYMEILSFDSEHVRMERLNAGAPMLDNHNRWSGTKGQFGVVERAWVEGGQGHATLRFAKDDESEVLMSKVEDGIVRNVSVGYNVFKYEEVESTESQSQGAAVDNKIPTLRAIDWEPFEISFAPVPADYTAGVRAAEENGVKPIEVPISNSHTTTNTDQDMKKRNLFRDAGSGNEASGGGTPAATPAAAPAAAPATTAEPAAAGEDGEASRAAGSAAELQRTLGIMNAVTAAKLPNEFARELIEGKHSLDKARELIIAKFSEGDTASTNSPNGGASVRVIGEAQSEKMRSAMMNALQHRCDPHVELTPEGREFRGQNMLGMAREFLVEAGVKVRGMSPREIAEMALVGKSRMGGMMSTSDFPIMLGQTIDITMQREYKLQNSSWRLLATQETATDFKEKTVGELSEVGDFKKIPEGGEYPRSSFGESKDSYKIEKFGEIIPVTWEAIINDNLDIFGKIPKKMARAWSRTQASLFWKTFLANPAMKDGNPLFHASHNNIANVGAIDIAGLGNARKLMRYQKDSSGSDYLDISPKYLIVGPELEQIAIQYTTSSFTPTAATQQNIWANLVKPIVEPRLGASTDWYFVADPNDVEGAVYAYLDGEELFTEQRVGFDVDGLEVKARGTFGLKFYDWRAYTKTPGA